MNPIDLARDFAGVALVVLLLGMKHGLDADHIAAIDGLTRYNSQARPGLARAAGVLFSLGHGVVVTSVAVGVSVLAHAWQVPRWIETFGAWVSIGGLTLLALLNIVAVLRTPSHEVARLRGWRSGLFARLLRAGSSATVMGVGALFALSFDTVSQAALFAATAARFGGWAPALALAALFIVGMTLIDGANGAWVARLIQRSDRGALAASRVMALVVSGIGLLTAALTFASLTLPGVGAWAQGVAPWLGAGVLTFVGIGYVFGIRLACSSQTGVRPIPIPRTACRVRVNRK